MSRGNYSVGKRQRDTEKARKKRQKEARRAQKRERGPGRIPVADPEDITGDLEAIERAQREKRAQAVSEARKIPCRLFVGSLSWGTTEEDLRTAFSAYGPVVDAVVISDRDTGKSRGFGFVTMENHKDAARAVEGMSDMELDGRSIVVSIATERQR